MRTWQVQIWGEGFVREGAASTFELTGVVEASDPDEAFECAVRLAKQQYPELSQADHPPGPGAVINADEIEEFSGAPQSIVGQIEVFWSHDGGA